MGSEVEESQGEPLGPTMQLGDRLEALCAQDSRQSGISENTRKGDSFPFNHVFRDESVCISVETVSIHLENCSQDLRDVLIQV